MTLKAGGILFFGFVLGIMAGTFIIQPITAFSRTAVSQSVASEEAAMIRFLVSLEKGQAKSYIELDEGTYRVGAFVDERTSVLIQCLPLGDIPLLVLDVPRGQIYQGYIKKLPPPDPM
ncbi:MAG: hypothetical protein V1656_01930 [Candidatus Jorgensenbacteria bacterium]